MGEKKGRSKFLFVLLGVFIVLFIGALLFALNAFGIKLPFNSDKTNVMKEALKENNYQAAYTSYASEGKTQQGKEILFQHLDEYFLICRSSEYTSNVWTRFRGLEIFGTDIQPEVLKEMDEIVSQYYDGTLTETDARTYLSRLSKFSFADDRYDECIKQISLKDYSDKAYNEGVTLYNEGKIEDAVKAFKKVSDKDGQRYPLALDAIERCKSEWGSVKIQEAQRMIGAYNKEGARALLENIIEIFGGYEEAESLLSTLDNIVEG